MGKWQFTKEKVSPLLTGYGKQISKGSLPAIALEISGRIEAGRVIIDHRPDSRVLPRLISMAEQAFPKKYFKCDIQPVPRPW